MRLTIFVVSVAILLATFGVAHAPVVKSLPMQQTTFSSVPVNLPDWLADDFTDVKTREEQESEVWIIKFPEGLIKVAELKNYDRHNSRRWLHAKLNSAIGYIRTFGHYPRPRDDREGYVIWGELSIVRQGIKNCISGAAMIPNFPNSSAFEIYFRDCRPAVIGTEDNKNSYAYRMSQWHFWLYTVREVDSDYNGVFDQRSRIRLR